MHKGQDQINFVEVYWFNPGRSSRITERLLSGRKESNQTNKQKLLYHFSKKCSLDPYQT